MILIGRMNLSHDQEEGPWGSWPHLGNSRTMSEQPLEVELAIMFGIFLFWSAICFSTNFVRIMLAPNYKLCYLWYHYKYRISVIRQRQWKYLNILFSLVLEVTSPRSQVLACYHPRALTIWCSHFPSSMAELTRSKVNFDRLEDAITNPSIIPQWDTSHHDP